MRTARAGARAHAVSARPEPSSTGSPRPSYRVLVYSHDSAGLGPLRRCHAIAHALVASHTELNVLILTSSPIVGQFRFRARVDFVRLPGVIKLRRGDHVSLGLDIDIDDTLALRASIIEHTAQAFRPHLFLVDGEPFGLLGEIRRTLALLKRRGSRLVLGLPDVIGDCIAPVGTSGRQRRTPALEQLYDHLWIYGLPEICDPMRTQAFLPRLTAKTAFTGYLGREAQSDVALPPDVAALAQKGPFLLVTSGGGAEGAKLIDTLLAAHERFDERLPWPSLIVYGPFLPARQRAAFERRAVRLERVTTLPFHEHLENVMAQAAAVLCVGGYNTFCEVLSLGKGCLIVPQAQQLVRAQAASKLGLVQMLPPEHLSPETLTDALTQLRVQPPPATQRIPGLLGGLAYITRTVGQWRPGGRAPRSQGR